MKMGVLFFDTILNIEYFEQNIDNNERNIGCFVQIDCNYNKKGIK